jgi:acetyl esterase/lipase
MNSCERIIRLGFALATVILAVFPASSRAQSSGVADWAAHLSGDYRVVPNITYLTANNWDAKLDVYTPSEAAGPLPTLIYIHGGGWVRGNKESNVLRILPYLQMGWAVVNVEYRLGPVSLAPAAVEDCRCALRWVIRNAEAYHFDVSRLVVSGNSAGGHLSLTTGMLPASAGLDRQCPGQEELKVAAIINWYGITDVADLLEGENERSYAVEWMGSMTDREAVARRVSPLTYVRADLPPIMTIHGDADPTVPYTHATRLKAALDQAGVSNELVTVPDGGHGGFSSEEMVDIFIKIRAFLSQHGIENGSRTSSLSSR